MTFVFVSCQGNPSFLPLSVLCLIFSHTPHQAAAMALQVFAAALPATNSGSFYLSVGGMLM